MKASRASHFGSVKRSETMSLTYFPVTEYTNGLRVRVLEEEGHAVIDLRYTAIHYETCEEILTNAGVTLSEEEWRALAAKASRILTRIIEFSRLARRTAVCSNSHRRCAGVRHPEQRYRAVEVFCSREYEVRCRRVALSIQRRWKGCQRVARSGYKANF